MVPADFSGASEWITPGINLELTRWRDIPGQRKVGKTIIELSDRENDLLRHIVETYLSYLREEIVRTEDPKWKPPLHEEEEMVKKLMMKIS